MRIVVTGASGFSGHYLISHLRQSSSDEIVCTARRAPASAECIACDLQDGNAIDALMDKIRPARVYHLAGTFSNDYEIDYRANVLSTRNLLQAILKKNFECRILLLGSAAEYGAIRLDENPINEEQPLRPVSAYGLSKVFQTYMMKFFFVAHKMDVVMARPFNLLGPGMSEKLFVGHVERQIELYKAGKIERISVGNLDHRRDYIRVEKAIEAYVRIMQRGKSGEIYNVGSGQSILLRDLLGQILEQHGIAKASINEGSRQAETFDVAEIFADTRKLNSLNEV